MSVRDALPVFRAERGPVSFEDTPEERRAREVREIKLRQVERGLAAVVDPIQAQVSGVALTVMDMHRPHVSSLDDVLRGDAPDCPNCTWHDVYGARHHAWPCATIRTIAASVGATLPTYGDEDDA